MLFRVRGCISSTRHTIVIFLALTATTLAQQAAPAAGGASDLAQLYAQGMSEFQAGDYAKAAADLDALLVKAEFSPQLEPAFFTVGSAYFNVPDHKKAIAAFKNYLAKFPNGPHAAEVSYAIGQAQLLSKNYSEAVAQFSTVEKDPRYREQALFFGATASKEGGKIDQAISTLEKLSGAGLKTPMSVRGAMMLAQLYSQKGKSDKTIAVIKKLHERIGLVDNIVELNAMTVELGDQLYAQKLFGDALECYRAAYPREQIVRLQNDRLSGMQRAIDENLAAARLDPSQFGQLAATNNQLKSDIARTQKLLDEFQKLPSITPAIYIRMARCFYEIDRKWEAVVVYQEIIDRFPQVAEREPALFGLIVALADVNGETELAVAEDEHAGQNTLGSFSCAIQSLRKETVSMRRLDDLFSEERLNRLDLIKVDIEGAETRLISGAFKLLRNLRPVVLFEASETALQNTGSSSTQLLDLFRKLGYDIYSFASETGRPIAAKAGEFSGNMIAAPAEAGIVAT